MKTFFITATDTDAGKTFVTEGLLSAFSEQGYTTAGFKPVASGCMQTDKGLRNEDATRLMEASSVKLPYKQVNSYAFEPAIAPHIAAELVGKSIKLSRIVENIRENSIKVDVVLVEGVGGWLVPLNSNQTIADLAQTLDFAVILVVNIRLGCINHALLTVQAIEQSGLPLAGWVANTGSINPPMDCLHENIDSLKARINAPLLAVLPKLDLREPAYKTVFSRMANTLFEAKQF